MTINLSTLPNFLVTDFFSRYPITIPTEFPVKQFPLSQLKGAGVGFQTHAIGFHQFLVVLYIMIQFYHILLLRTPSVSLITDFRAYIKNEQIALYKL